MNFLEPWYAALASLHGVAVATNDVEVLKQRLYVARRTSNDPDLVNLAIVLPPQAPGELWIIKK